MSTCRLCGSSVIWALSDQGAFVPIDPEPVGDSIADEVGACELVTIHGRGNVRKMRAVAEGPVYAIHFTTCPMRGNAATERPDKHLILFHLLQLLAHAEEWLGPDEWAAMVAAAPPIELDTILSGAEKILETAR